ncbi:MAG: orotidine-5'-phosphate decarboxylase [Bacteroidia bacterium]|nr:orotidine-5'-phosphate decarboxylase [Bacteroidia bacterium]MDW8158560.1 orotidine-5'-phosphate decarboxylase [Bacteroidia bacterium]
MNEAALLTAIYTKRSFLCIGLDTEYEKIPSFLHKERDPIFSFNKSIIEATASLAVAYKLNLAFYEVLGIAGWKTLEKTLEIIPSNILIIADAKRGDIQNTSRLYAKTFFETFHFDAITVNPYMGKDSLIPYFSYPEKWVFVLALTSNSGAQDFQHCVVADDIPLFEYVMQTIALMPKKAEIGFVVGATYPEILLRLRKRFNNTFFLVPGIGAQGGNLSQACKAGPKILLSASRSVLYASNDHHFAEGAYQAAFEMVAEMQKNFDFKQTY